MTETNDIMRDDEFEAAVQQAFLDAFPNPNRTGCPNDKVLQSLAANKSPVNDEADAHIAQCSPCARQILAFREEIRKRRQTRRLWTAAVACLAVAFSLGVYRQFFSRRNVGPDQLKVAPVIVAKLDFSKELPETRRASEAPPEIQKIPANAQELLIILKAGSPTGKYEFRIRPEQGHARPEKVVRGNASQQLDGSTVLRIALKGGLPSGAYTASWRRRKRAIFGHSDYCSPSLSFWPPRVTGKF